MAGATAERRAGATGAEAANGNGGQAAQDLPLVETPRVDGSTQLGFFKAGGKSPDSATLKLTGGAIELVQGTAFRKGDVIQGTFTAVVREVGQRDKEDSKTGHVVSCKQKHEARITDLQLK